MSAEICLLVDGDNVSARHSDALRKAASERGQLAIARVYCNAAVPSDWHDAAGMSLIHAGRGKNASDVLLAIEAMEALFSRGIRQFVIATSDGDFSHLALRLREHGARVLGVGMPAAARRFREACNDFLVLPGSKPAPAAEGVVINPVDQKLLQLIRARDPGGEGFHISRLGAAMHQLHKVDLAALSVKSWRAYLEARPDLFTLDPKGPEARVRLNSAVTRTMI